MRVLESIQQADLFDPVRSKFAMVAPVLEATLYSLALDRVQRLGGYEKLTLAFPLQFLGRRGGVLDRVMQECRDEGRHVRDAADVCEDAGHLERMIDVRRRIIAFAALMPMPLS